MPNSEIKQKLHEFIDVLDDKKAEAIYTLLQTEPNISAQRKRIVLAERENYLNGNINSFTWDEIKLMAIDKSKRSAL
jgi:hypothetical protein